MRAIGEVSRCAVDGQSQCVSNQQEVVAVVVEVVAALGIGQAHIQLLTYLRAALVAVGNLLVNKIYVQARDLGAQPLAVGGVDGEFKLARGVLVAPGVNSQVQRPRAVLLGLLEPGYLRGVSLRAQFPSDVVDVAGNGGGVGGEHGAGSFRGCEAGTQITLQSLMQ